MELVILGPPLPDDTSVPLLACQKCLCVSSPQSSVLICSGDHAEMNNGCPGTSQPVGVAAPISDLPVIPIY